MAKKHAAERYAILDVSLLRGFGRIMHDQDRLGASIRSSRFDDADIQGFISTFEASVLHERIAVDASAVKYDNDAAAAVAALGEVVQLCEFRVPSEWSSNLQVEHTTLRKLDIQPEARTTPPDSAVVSEATWRLIGSLREAARKRGDDDLLGRTTALLRRALGRGDSQQFDVAALLVDAVDHFPVSHPSSCLSRDVSPLEVSPTPDQNGSHGSSLSSLAFPIGSPMRIAVADSTLGPQHSPGPLFQSDASPASSSLVDLICASLEQEGDWTFAVHHLVRIMRYFAIAVASGMPLILHPYRAQGFIEDDMSLEHKLVHDVASGVRSVWSRKVSNAFGSHFRSLPVPPVFNVAARENLNSGADFVELLRRLRNDKPTVAYRKWVAELVRALRVGDGKTAGRATELISSAVCDWEKSIQVPPGPRRTIKLSAFGVGTELDLPDRKLGSSNEEMAILFLHQITSTL